MKSIPFLNMFLWLFFFTTQILAHAVCSRKRVSPNFGTSHQGNEEWARNTKNDSGFGFDKEKTERKIK